MCYRYQTGALTPIVRWLSQSMQRAAAPPRPPRPAARAENVPAARQEADNAAPAGMICLHFNILANDFACACFFVNFIDRRS